MNFHRKWLRCLSHRHPFFWVVLLAIACCASAPVGAQKAPILQYTVTELWSVDGSYSNAYGINNKGHVVGEVNGHACLWQTGKTRDLGTLNGMTGSRATAINDRGQVVGVSYSGRRGDAGWRAHPFIWQDGVMSDLGTLGSEDGIANAINNKGQVVGKSYDPVDGFRAFMWQDGKMKQLSAGSDSEAMGINEAGLIVCQQKHVRAEDRGMVTSPILGIKQTQRLVFIDLLASGKAINTKGQIVGESVFGEQNRRRAFLYTNEKITDLGALAGMGSSAAAINNTGQVVGWSSVPVPANEAIRETPRHAVLWTDGKILDLNTCLTVGSDWLLTEANGINDQGQIVGQGYLHGNMRAFLLTPVAR